MTPSAAPSSIWLSSWVCYSLSFLAEPLNILGPSCAASGICLLDALLIAGATPGLPCLPSSVSSSPNPSGYSREPYLALSGREALRVCLCGTRRTDVERIWRKFWRHGSLVEQSRTRSCAFASARSRRSSCRSAATTSRAPRPAMTRRERVASPRSATLARHFRRSHAAARVPVEQDPYAPRSRDARFDQWPTTSSRPSRRRIMPDTRRKSDSSA